MATREQVLRAMKLAGLGTTAVVQSTGSEVLVEGDCQLLGGLQMQLEAEGIASTLDAAEEEASWVTHGARRSTSNCVIAYSLRIPVN